MAQRIVGQKHARITVDCGGRHLTAMRFGETGPFPASIDAVYRLDVNEWNGTQSLQLIVEHWSG